MNSERLSGWGNKTAAWLVGTEPSVHRGPGGLTAARPHPGCDVQLPRPLSVTDAARVSLVSALCAQEAQPVLPRHGCREQAPGPGKGPRGAPREPKSEGPGLLCCCSYVHTSPCPVPHPPYHWAWRVRTRFVQSPLGLEAGSLCLWRNEPGFPLLTSLLIRF